MVPVTVVFGHVPYGHVVQRDGLNVFSYFVSRTKNFRESSVNCKNRYHICFSGLRFKVFSRSNGEVAS